jgi:hypothetical protein
MTQRPPWPSGYTKPWASRMNVVSCLQTPTAHLVAHLRIDDRVTADAARLATVWAGWLLTGRVSHPRDDSQGFMTSSHHQFSLTRLAWPHRAPTPRSSSQAPSSPERLPGGSVATSDAGRRSAPQRSPTYGPTGERAQPCDCKEKAPGGATPPAAAAGSGATPPAASAAGGETECPSCHHQVPLADRFCKTCGKQMRG